MSLITSCPACGTMFRVVPDQLKISEGWVRCGHCGEVFDATAHLSDESVLGPLADAQGTRPAELRASPPPPPAPPPPRPPPPPPPVRARAPEQPPTIPAPLQTRPGELYARPSADTSTTSVEPSDFFGEEESHPGLEPSPLDAPFVFRRSEITERELATGPEPGEESQMLPEEFEEEQRRLRDVSFVRKARRRSVWRRPWMRVLLALTSLALAAVLVLQFAYQDRDRLALAQPILRPALEQMCELMHCRLGAPRQIEAIVIESSGFNRLRSDTYRLAFTLRNTAPVQLAIPSMELTITDSQDQTIARRVLTPAELGVVDNGVIPAASEWSRTVGIVLNTSGAARVAGYRLLAFYP
jgi:predicted Zn finger-like uncharacterized protein